MGITPDWLAAIGTITVAIVALVVAFLPILIRRYNKPEFQIEFENEEPFCRKAISALEPRVVDGQTRNFPIISYYLRIRVTNKGRSVAKACEGKLVEFKEVESVNDPIQFDPRVLNWSGSGTSAVDINKTEIEYLDIINSTENRLDKLFIGVWDPKPHGINIEPPRREYSLKVTIYGENVEPFSQSFLLKITGANYDQIELHVQDEH